LVSDNAFFFSREAVDAASESVPALRLLFSAARCSFSFRSFSASALTAWLSSSQVV
jgi:hypothetical protein